jgi:hypothetical protein
MLWLKGIRKLAAQKGETSARAIVAERFQDSPSLRIHQPVFASEGWVEGSTEHGVGRAKAEGRTIAVEPRADAFALAVAIAEGVAGPEATADARPELIEVAEAEARRL